MARLDNRQVVSDSIRRGSIAALATEPDAKLLGGSDPRAYSLTE